MWALFVPLLLLLLLAHMHRIHPSIHRLWCVSPDGDKGERRKEGGRRSTTRQAVTFAFRNVMFRYVLLVFKNFYSDWESPYLRQYSYMLGTMLCHLRRGGPRSVLSVCPIAVLPLVSFLSVKQAMCEGPTYSILLVLVLFCSVLVLYIHKKEWLLPHSFITHPLLQPPATYSPPPPPPFPKPLSIVFALEYQGKEQTQNGRNKFS